MCLTCMTPEDLPVAVTEFSLSTVRTTYRSMVKLLLPTATMSAVLQDDLTQYAPDSEAQQQIVMSIADRDAFNWG